MLQENKIPSQPLDLEEQLLWADALLVQAKSLKKETKFTESLEVLDVILAFYAEKLPSAAYIDALVLYSMVRRVLDVLHKSTFDIKAKLIAVLEEYKEENRSLAEAYDELGMFSLWDGSPDQLGFDFFKKGLSIKQAIYEEENVSISISFENLGVFYCCCERYDEAINFHNKALQIRLNLTNCDPRRLADGYWALSSCYRLKGDNETSYYYQKKSLTLRLKVLGEKHPSIASNYSNLGNNYKLMGDYNKAIECYGKALKIREEIFGEKYGKSAIAHNNLGDCYKDMGAFVKAEEHFQKALSILKDLFGKYHYMTAHTYYNLGGLCIAMNDFEQAFLYFKKALQGVTLNYTNDDIYHHADYKIFIANSAWVIRDILNKMLEGHLKRYNELQVGTTDDWVFALYTAQVNDSFINDLRQDLEMDDASKLTLAQNAFTAFDHSIEIAYQAALMANNNSEWDSSVERIKEINRASYLDRNFLDFIDSYDCLEIAFEFCERNKSMILYGGIKDKEARGKSLIAEDLLNELKYWESKIHQHNKAIYEVESQLGQADKKQLLGLQSKRFDDDQAYQILIKRLEVEYPAYYQHKYNSATISPSEIGSYLDQDMALLEYFVGDKSIFIFLICATNEDLNGPAYQVFRVEKPSNFNKMIQSFDRSINKNPNRRKYVQLAYELYELLLGPISDALIQKGIKQLKIIPDGILGVLPFEALIMEAIDPMTPYADLPYLLVHYDISYHFSATLWLWERKQKDKRQKVKNSFLGLAPVYKDMVANRPEVKQKLIIPEEENRRGVRVGGKEYQSLIYSEEEVKKIQEEFEGKNYTSESLLHEAATIENFKLKAPNYKFIHIAAHHIFNQKSPKLSGIIFSPSLDKEQAQEEDDLIFDEEELNAKENDHAIFYISDAYQMRLNADLVVLSCCDTGKGEFVKGEGIMAINRGFLYAGASNVLYTLFKVYDKESSLLIRHFFSWVLKNNSSYSQALQAAKLSLIMQGVSPKYWAGYVLVGC